MKKCKTCNISKSEIDFYTKIKKKVSGETYPYIVSECKTCWNKRTCEHKKANKTYKENFKRLLTDNNITTFKCSVCNKFLSKECFHKSGNYIHSQCKSCRSINRKTEILIKETDINYLKNKIFLAAKKSAKNRNIYFDLALEDIIVPKQCPYLGIVLTYAGDRDSSFSIDRIDNSKGYIKGNIQVISTLANMCKRNLTELDLILFANNILKLHSR